MSEREHYPMNQRQTETNHEYLLMVLDDMEPGLVERIQPLMNEFAQTYCEPVCRFEIAPHAHGLMRISVWTIDLDKAPIKVVQRQGCHPDVLEAVEIALNRFLGVLSGLGFSDTEWWLTDPHGQDSPADKLVIKPE